MRFYWLKSCSRWILYGFLAISLFVSIKPHSLQKWKNAVDWLQSIDFSKLDSYGRLFLHQESNSLEPVVNNSCQALWKSRLSASRDLEQAGVWLIQGKSCDRLSLVSVWSGQLAWLQGNKRIALSEWAVLTDTKLLNWGRNLIRSGNVVQGEFLLKFLAQKNQTSLSPHDQAQLLLTLGESSLAEDFPTIAVDYLERSWRIERGYKIAFNLGYAYARMGDCSRALKVLETGLSFKDHVFRPFLGSSYLATLGQCYEQTSQIDKARRNYNLALQMLYEADQKGVNGVKSRIAWIEQLMKSLPDAP